MLSETNTHSFENRGLERYKIDFSTLMSTAWWTTVHGGYDLVKPIDVPENIFIARRVAGLHQTMSETTDSAQEEVGPKGQAVLEKRFYWCQKSVIQSLTIPCL